MYGGVAAQDTNDVICLSNTIREQVNIFGQTRNLLPELDSLLPVGSALGSVLLTVLTDKGKYLAEGFSKRDLPRLLTGAPVFKSLGSFGMPDFQHLRERF